MIRFIHAADIHLDSLMKGIRSDSAGIDPQVFRESTRNALRNLVDWAIAEKVDFVTLGGDNYDGDWRDYATGLRFNAEMARLTESGIPVVSITGNHDAANVMTRQLAMPGNFHKLDENAPGQVEPMDGVRVIGQGFRNRVITENLAARYPENDSSHGIVIGLLHTSLAGAPSEGHDNYAPCELADLRRKRYHFWGLGHIHKAGWMHQPGDTPVLYPGNLQGRHIRETGPKGAWLIGLDDSGMMIEERFRALDTTRWELLTLDISGIDDAEGCFQAVSDRIDDLVRSSGNRLLAIRIRFTGRSNAHMALRKLHEGQKGDLLAKCANEAVRVAPGRAWVEAVELHSSAPAPARGHSDSMRVLLEFVTEKAADRDWIENFLAGDEIQKLRSQLACFEKDDELRQIQSLFEPESLRKLIEVVPETLESRLDSESVAESEV